MYNQKLKREGHWTIHLDTIGELNYYFENDFKKAVRKIEKIKINKKQFYLVREMPTMDEDSGEYLLKGTYRFYSLVKI